MKDEVYRYLRHRIKLVKRRQEQLLSADHRERLHYLDGYHDALMETWQWVETQLTLKDHLGRTKDGQVHSKADG